MVHAVFHNSPLKIVFLNRAGCILQEPENRGLYIYTWREGKAHRIVGGLGISSLAIQRFRIPNRTCRSLMYQVRLAAGLLRPDVQFKRSVSPIRYFLLNPSIDGPWEGNSAEQETSGTYGARKYAKHVRNAALTFDHSYMCILYINIYILYVYMYIHTHVHILELDIGVEETFQDCRMRQPVCSRVHRTSR